MSLWDTLCWEVPYLSLMQRLKRLCLNPAPRGVGGSCLPPADSVTKKYKWNLRFVLLNSNVRSDHQKIWMNGASECLKWYIDALIQSSNATAIQNTKMTPWCIDTDIFCYSNTKYYDDTMMHWYSHLLLQQYIILRWHNDAVIQLPSYLLPYQYKILGWYKDMALQQYDVMTLRGCD